MTVSSTNNFVQYVGNGLSTFFDYDFNIPDADSLVVTIRTIATNVGVVLTPDQYTITGLGSNTGGAVTYPLAGAPLPTTQRIEILRRTNPVQELSVSNQTAYDAGIVEKVWDRLTLGQQDLFKLSDESIRAPTGETAPIFFPGTPGRAVIYDDDGNLVEGPNAADIESAQPAAAQAVESATEALASQTAAANTLIDFEASYLGAKINDPTQDNAGEPLIDGALYFNTTTNKMRVYDLATTTWLDVNSNALLPTNNLSDLANAPIARTNLQLSAEHVAQGSSVTITAADRTKLYEITSPITLGFAAAATLGNVFYVDIDARSGDCVISPNGSETIDGETSATIRRGRKARIYSDGSNLKTSFLTSSSTTLIDITAAQASMDVAVPFGCNYFRLSITRYEAAANAASLRMRVGSLGVDGSYLETAVYNTVGSFIRQDATINSLNFSSQTSWFLVPESDDTTTKNSGFGSFDFQGFRDINERAVGSGLSEGMNATAANYVSLNATMNIRGAPAAGYNAIRFFASSGNIQTLKARFEWMY